MEARRLVAAFALVASTASAFLPTAPNRSPDIPSLPSPPLQQHRPHVRRAARDESSLRQSDRDAGEGGEEYDEVDFFVSPRQIALLRKEAAKRGSRNKLPKFYLSPDESAGASSEIIDEISILFDASELVEVRGVSKDAKRRVFNTAHDLAATLEDTIEKPVVVVDIKGFSVRLYCPWDDEQGVTNERIRLRTSYQPGQWTRKSKPVRDNRGQIIRDENGKTIREVPDY